MFGLLVVLMVACTGGEPTEDPTTSSTVAPPTTTTTTVEPTPTSGLDLSDVPVVSHGPEGLLLLGGTVLWETDPFPAGVARDHEGGIAFTDSSGLWWYRKGAVEPELVGGVTGELITVIRDSDEPVAMVWDGSQRFYRLSDGEEVGQPATIPVDIADTVPNSWVWTAENGLSVWVTGPTVETDTEGQPSEVVEPARLRVGQGDEIIEDVQIGSVYETWVRIHDFDGRLLLVSRGPLEPAMAEETFLVIDLASGDVTKSFVAGGTAAALTGADADWTGPVMPIDLAAYTPPLVASDDGVNTLADGRYLVYLRDVLEDGAEVAVDVAVWFTGNEANMAARIDGETDVPVPNDYYIRNLDPSTIAVAVSDSPEVTSVWYDYDSDPDLENDTISYEELLEVLGSDDEVRSQLRTSPWWVTVEDGKIIALDEQYVP